jgi:flagellar biosynthetic protein FliR
MEILGFWLGRLDLFLVILARVSGIFLMTPVLGSQQTPATVRISLSLILTALIGMTLNPGGVELPSQLLGLCLILVSEMAIGFLIGFLVYLTFAAVTAAGQIIDMQMGFGVVNVMDPQFGTQMPLLGNFQYLLAVLVFLGLNGHHVVLTALFKSYDLIPLNGFLLRGGLVEYLIQLVGGMLVTAIKISAPIVGALFAADFALGVLARTVPQLNVFVVGLPLKVFLGLLVLLATIPLYVWLVGKLLTSSFRELEVLLRLIGR